MFIPSGVTPNENKVHIFFSAGGISGDVLNSVTCHAFRAAASSTDWILIAVEGNDAGLNTISAQDVLKFITACGRPNRIDKVRLSSHSRGFFGLCATLKSKTLIDTSPTPPVLNSSIVERVISFDSDSSKSPVMPAITAAGIPSTKVFGFWVTVYPPSWEKAKDSHGAVLPTEWSIPQSQTIDLLSDPVIKRGVRAVEYCRLIDDARTLRPTLTIPDDIDKDKQGNRLPLPALGSFTTRRNAAAPLADFRSFCKTHKDSTEDLVGPEVRLIRNSNLYHFIDSNDLARIGHTGTNPGIWHHHLFVSEFAHEVTDAPSRSRRGP
jgi:hypothetical protein